MTKPMSDPNMKIRKLERKLNEANERTRKRLWGVVNLFLDVFGDEKELQKVANSAVQHWQKVQMAKKEQEAERRDRKRGRKKPKKT